MARQTTSNRRRDRKRTTTSLYLGRDAEVNAMCRQQISILSQPTHEDGLKTIMPIHNRIELETDWGNMPLLESERARSIQVNRPAMTSEAGVRNARLFHMLTHHLLTYESMCIAKQVSRPLPSRQLDLTTKGVEDHGPCDMDVD